MKTHRLKLLADAIGISINQLEKRVGVGTSTFNKAIQRDSEINQGIALMIIEKFPQVSRDWLLTGEGDMFVNTPSTHKKIGKTSTEGSYADWKGDSDMLYRIIKDVAALEERVRKLEEGRK